MASEVTKAPTYRHTMQRLEEVKRSNSQGDDYWVGREIFKIVGYATWDSFTHVIGRAEASMTAAGGDPSHHIRHTTKLVGVGDGGRRRVAEYFLSRGACYLIAMNGDPSKPEVASAQHYFAAQTRVAELSSQEASDRKRLGQREKVKAAVKRVGDVAKDAGVTSYGLFHDARYRAFYDTSKTGIERTKGIRPGEDLFARAGSLELSAHAFQMELAATKITNENICGERLAIAANFDVAKQVRRTVEEQSGTSLSDLPLEPEPIASVEKRLKTQARLPKPKAGRSA
jgi:DNA-damage-inducible protein D